MENIMDTNHTTNKGKVMDTLESFYIFRESNSYNQTNGKLTVKVNAIFETIVHEDPYKRHNSVTFSGLAHNSVLKGSSLLVHANILLRRRSFATIQKKAVLLP